MFGKDSICDELELGLIGRRSLLLLGSLVTCLFVGWQVAVELGVKLVPDLPGEAKLAELRKNCPQEILQVHSQVVLSDLQQHWLGLPEVTAS